MPNSTKLDGLSTRSDAGSVFSVEIRKHGTAASIQTQYP